jgi:hypothetical protein
VLNFKHFRQMRPLTWAKQGIQAKAKSKSSRARKIENKKLDVNAG